MSILKEAKKQVRFAHVEKILMKSTLNNEDVKKLADETTNRLAKRYQKKLRQSQMLLVVDENVVISSLNQIDPGDDE